MVLIIEFSNKSLYNIVIDIYKHVISIYKHLYAPTVRQKGHEMFKPGKAYEKTRKEYDKRTGAIAEKRKDLEDRINENAEKLKEVEAAQLEAKENLNFILFKELEEEEKALRSDKSTLESFLSLATKIVTPEEAKTMSGEIEAEYRALIREYDKKIIAILEEYNKTREDFEAIARVYNRLSNDLQFGSTGKYDNRLSIEKVFSPYWSMNTNGTFDRLQNTLNAILHNMNYKK